LTPQLVFGFGGIRVSDRITALVESVFAFEELPLVLGAFRYALTQIDDENTRSVVAQEFWHALNRRSIVRNDEVYGLIEQSLARLVNT
jgi:hypothetical protein